MYIHFVVCEGQDWAKFNEEKRPKSAFRYLKIYSNAWLHAYIIN